MDSANIDSKVNNDWLSEILEEVNLQSFQSKLINDLQLTKLSHFEFVSEGDLIELGLSRPAAKRLLAAVKKRKSFVNNLKNRIVGKLLPIGAQSTSFGGYQDKANDLRLATPHGLPVGNNESTNIDHGRLTCLIDSQDIQVKEEIGNGVHGFVKKGEWTSPNGRVIEVALKILKKDVMDEPGASFNDFVKEISVMHQLNHPNIIKLYGIVLSSPMMMVTELAPYGNLRDKLRKEEGRTPISLLIYYGVQISSGMAYLESRRFVHRDLAARNIFISHGKKILIGDLGLMRAVPVQDNLYVMSERTKIPYPWCAPESLKSKQFSSASDVYMFGVTMWEMFTFGDEPWSGLSLNQIVDKISTEDQRLPCPDSCPIMVYQTLLQCWSIDPKMRPNFGTLYQYLSTSYPLEVQFNQPSSEIRKGLLDGKIIPDDLLASHPKLQNSSQPEIYDQQAYKTSVRKELDCQLEDRILVIDGQPEKYWWKGQNQRTFEIGWFPLSSTRWLAPKRNPNYISKPLKNSFVHTGHCGADGRWGNPKYIDRIYLKNPLFPDDVDSCKRSKFHPVDGPNSQVQPIPHRHSNLSPNLFSKQKKTRSRLSRLFGIHDNTSQNAHIINHAYQRFIDEQTTRSRASLIRKEIFSNSITRSQSDELRTKHITASTAEIHNKMEDDEPPLIDFSDEADCIPQNPSSTPVTVGRTTRNDDRDEHQQESLIDMDTTFPPIEKDVFEIDNDTFSINHRHASETRLDEIDQISWAGSWNTGTFYGSNSNIYSTYYCPQDAAQNVLTPKIDDDLSSTSNRYYSAVTQDDGA